jgi:Domain of unknown function (DUF4288)
MAYIPKDAKWFLAYLVEEIRVQDSKRNIVHINYVIIRANSPEEAYLRAMALGKAGNMTYLNPMRKKVTIRFRGLRNLDVIHDPLGDECEILFTEKLGVSEENLKKMLRRKRDLEVFQPIRGRSGRPDYSSKEIMDEFEKRLQKKR